jgi:hypothetical protein
MIIYAVSTKHNNYNIFYHHDIVEICLFFFKSCSPDTHEIKRYTAMFDDTVTPEKLVEVQEHLVCLRNRFEETIHDDVDKGFTTTEIREEQRTRHINPKFNLRNTNIRFR